MISDFSDSYYRSNYDSGACQSTNYDTAGGRMINWRSSYSGRSGLYRDESMIVYAAKI